jgi:hypothetical protein
MEGDDAAPRRSVWLESDYSGAPKFERWKSFLWQVVQTENLP